MLRWQNGKIPGKTGKLSAKTENLEMKKFLPHQIVRFHGVFFVFVETLLPGRWHDIRKRFQNSSLLGVFWYTSFATSYSKYLLVLKMGVNIAIHNHTIGPIFSTD